MGCSARGSSLLRISWPARGACQARSRQQRVPYPAGMARRQRLIVVSNRLPLTARRVSGRWRSERSAGGLVAAMAPLMERFRGLWLGWPGDALPDEPQGRARLMAEWEARHGYVAVEIPARVS